MSNNKKIIEKFQSVLNNDFKRVEGIHLISEMMQGNGVTVVKVNDQQLNVHYLPMRLLKDKTLRNKIEEKMTKEELKNYMFVLFFFEGQPITFKIRKQFELIERKQSKDDRIQKLNF